MGNSIPDEDPIAKLYQELYGRMAAYAFSVLGDRNLAEEAVQDTFCIFCTKTEAALQHENPQGWLMRTLQNVMRNMQRRRAAMNRLIMRSLQVEDLEELLVYDEEDVDLLYGDLAARTDFQLLKRVVLDGCTMLEAAEEYGITVEACKKRIQRIRAFLKKNLPISELHVPNSTISYINLMRGGSAVSAPEGNQKRDYSRYDQMSTAELEQLLRLDFQASGDGDSDLDAILYISGLLAQRNGPSDPGAAWAQFQAKYRPYADGRSLYDFEDGEDASPPEPEPASAPVRSRRVRHLRRLAVLAAVLAACLLWGMVAQAAGVDVFGSIAQWTDETFHFVSPGSRGTSSGTDGEVAEGLNSSLQALGMQDWFPAWYPHGFVPGELNVTQLNSSVSADVTFSGEGRSYCVWVDHFTQPQSQTGTFEKDGTPVEEYDHNGQVFYILSNLDTLTATTFDGEFLTMIYGSLTREEIKAVIDSIPGP